MWYLAGASPGKTTWAVVLPFDALKGASAFVSAERRPLVFFSLLDGVNKSHLSRRKYNSSGALGLLVAL